ncbi:MAG: thioredoxin TrxC [Alphaproteobacteria bacterium]|nr:thioredoxin TrxC [Alphaproteobacteria bacterium]
MSAESRHVVCPHCDGMNRIPADRRATAARCGHCHAPLFTGTPIAADEAKFTRHVARNDIPVLVDFWAAWCGPCRAMAPAFERLAAEMEPDIRLLKVDVDAQPAVAARYGIRSIPTLILFRAGAVAAQAAGAMDARGLHAWVHQHLGR